MHFTSKYVLQQKQYSKKSHQQSTFVFQAHERRSDATVVDIATFSRNSALIGLLSVLNCLTRFQAQVNIVQLNNRLSTLRKQKWPLNIDVKQGVLLTAESDLEVNSRSEFVQEPDYVAVGLAKIHLGLGGCPSHAGF